MAAAQASADEKVELLREKEDGVTSFSSACDMKDASPREATLLRGGPDPESRGGGDTEEQRSQIAKYKPEWLPKELFQLPFSLGVPEEVWRMMVEKACEGEAAKMTMFDVAGPAVCWAWRALGVQAVASLVFPCIVYHVTDCPAKGSEPLAMETPIWVWALMAPALVASMYTEWKCFMLVLVPMTQWLDNFDYAPVVRKPRFYLWLAITALMTLMAHSSAISTGIFIGKLWHQQSCPEADHVDWLWKQVMDQVSFKWEPHFNVLKTILLAHIGLMLVQLVVCLMQAVPMSTNVSYKYKSEKDGYRVCLHTVHHADVLKALSSGSRMALLGPLYKQQLVRAHAALKKPEGAVPPNTRFMDILTREMRKVVSNFFLYGFLQSLVQLESQSVLYALGRALAHKETKHVTPRDRDLLLTVLLGGATALQGIALTCMKLRDIREATLKVNWEADMTADDRAGATSYRYEIKRLSVYLVVLLIASFLAVLHCGMRMVQVFRCPDSIWNLPATCVEFKDLHLTD